MQLCLINRNVKSVIVGYSSKTIHVIVGVECGVPPPRTPLSDTRGDTRKNMASQDHSQLTDVSLQK